jgi:RNA polymerase sigma factor (sigma-70 family)
MSAKWHKRTSALNLVSGWPTFARSTMVARFDQCNRCLFLGEILKGPASGSAFWPPRKTMSATSQQSVMPLYESVMLLRGSFPCRPATIGVIVAVPSRRRQAERRVDQVQAEDAGDLRRSAWMAAAQAGDSAAYRALLRDCIPIIKSVARRRGVSADHLDDVVQDVLLTIHRARQTYDPRRSFTAWLCVISDRRAIDLLRRVRRQHVREVNAPVAFENHADQAADPALGLVHVDAARTVTCALASLPTRQREAVQHLVLEERSLADAAALTRRTAGSLKINLHRALKALRNRMESWE